MQPYRPDYDPMHDTTPGEGSAYAPSYWVESAGSPPPDDGKLAGEHTSEVVIIGAGFTGLATALFLAREHQVQATVLEANFSGWGCTSRNGGQGHLAWGRLSRSQWVKRWGESMALEMHRNTLEGFEVFRQLTEEIDCEPHGDGNLLIAHSRSALKHMIQESEVCNQVLHYPTQILDTATVHEEYLKDCEAHGGLLEPVGIAVHPLKLAFGYLELARHHGAKVHSQSPVVAWEQRGDTHYVRTPEGCIKAKHVVIATAGYTHPSLHPLLAYKNMPIMANSAVTRVLRDDEIAECRLQTKLILTDSRKLRYYYRFLPDKRLQIGTRSAISGKEAEHPKHLQMVHDAIARKFPPLKGVQVDYFWSGWMDISHDMIPRIVQPDATQSIYYAQGYSGNGVSFSAYAAKKLAELVVGKKINSDLPIFSSALPSHPLRPLRRFGQRLLYRYFSVLDTLP